MKNSAIMVITLTVFVLVFGCETERPSSFAPSTPDDAVEAMVDPSSDAGEVTVVEGVIGPGAMYALYTPADWNGDLVVYAHGYVFPFRPVALPSIDELRDGLLDMGYAVAYSSYSETGYTVKEGIQATRQLSGIFKSKFGVPDDTYLIGHSMGGLITAALGESNRVHYSGLMPMCGIVGGSRMALSNIYNVRALFDYFYPGVIPGDAQSVPEGLDPATAAFGLAVPAMLANPLPAFELAGVTQANIQYNDPNELVETIATRIFFQVGSFADAFDRAHGHYFFDNMETVYEGSADDAALNAGIGRFASTPDADNFLQQWYQPKGKLNMPVITLHTTRDPVVPLPTEYAYAATVEEAGYGHMLRQYEIDRFGHCSFTTEEMLGAFSELVDWVAAMATVEPARARVD